MAQITVQRVETARQRKQFLELPWQIYRDDPNWVPPLRFEQKELVGYRPHPFYERNRCQTFLAYRGNEVCGRIAAIVNEDHMQLHGERRGFFGFFECTDDQHAAEAMFDAAAAWLAEQDIHQLRGPLSPSMNYVAGALVEGFDSPPSMMMAYNRPYYPQLIESCGFAKAQDLYAYWGDLDMLPASSAKVGPVSDQIIERYNVKVRCLDPSRFREDIQAFLSIYNRSMTRHWGFVPLSPKEVEHLASGLRHLIVPELAIMAEIDGKPVGTLLCLLDFNPRIKRINGRLWPFGFARLLWISGIKKVRVVAANVLPEYQLFGVGLVLLREVLPAALSRGIREVEYSWIAESNQQSRGALEKGGAKRIKTYRVYDRG